MPFLKSPAAYYPAPTAVFAFFIGIATFGPLLVYLCLSSAHLFLHPQAFRLLWVRGSSFKNSSSLTAGQRLLLFLFGRKVFLSLIFFPSGPIFCSNAWFYFKLSSSSLEEYTGHLFWLDLISGSCILDDRSARLSFFQLTVHFFELRHLRLQELPFSPQY